MPISVYLHDDLMLVFCYSNWALETGGFELNTTIALCVTVEPTNPVRL